MRLTMILFQKDWEEQGALPDWETKNKSFVEMALLYREMGIKNYAWPLALYDQGLKGIDPFDPNITPDLALRVAIEAKDNPLYFFREIARDPQGSPEFPISFRANRGILAAYWLFFNHILIILIMIRQTGKSFGIDWLLVWLLNIGLTKAEINHITKDEKLRGRGVERIKEMELTLPAYLKQRGVKDAGNTEVLRISSMGNAIKFHLPNRSKKLADLVGRGMTSSTVVGDEFAYLANNFITIPVMLAATLAAREVSKMKQEPYGTIFMTTSGKRDTPEGRYAYNFMQNAAVWSEKFFDAQSLEELEDMVKRAGNGKDLRVNCTFNHRQLGQTDQWLRDRLRESAQDDEVQIKADFLNEWPSGTMSSPFSQEVAQLIRESEVIDFFSRIEEPEPYVTRWYYSEHEIATKLREIEHVLSVDPSDAIGSDGIGITLRNVYTGEVAMAADVSESNLIAFCRWLAGFLKKYSKVTLIIERRSSGAMILDFLLEYLPSIGIDPFARIYNQVVQYKEEYPERFREIQQAMHSRENLYLKYKKYFGWATSGSGATSRSDLFSRTLTVATKMTGSLMKDRKLILQILGLEVRNGRIDHAEGEHDDLVISWLLSFWLISQGKNLEYYGINASKILVENPHFKKDLDEVPAYEREMSSEAKKEIERLTDLLKDERDEYMVRRLEYDLELAISKLNEQDKKVIAVDDLVNRLREERFRNLKRGPSYGGYESDTQRGYVSYGIGNNFTNPIWN